MAADNKPTILKVGKFAMLPELEQALKERGTYFVDSALSEEERIKVRAQTDFVIASGGTRFQKEDYDSCPQLKGIVCFSVGYDKIDVKEAIARNVFLTHTPDVLSDEVANTALMLLLTTTRQCKAAQDYIEEGVWGLAPAFPLTTSIGGKKLGIAGLGRIGKEIASRALSFKMEVGYYGRHPQADITYPYFSSLAELAKWSDVLLLAMPATADNKHCVNKEILEQLGQQGYLINIARGSLVDTAALIAALDQGTIAGAGLDVFENEPQVPEALWHRPNVILQPHVGSATKETRLAMANLVITNLDAILHHEAVRTPVPGTRKQ